jgi:hypothetical protein
MITHANRRAVTLTEVLIAIFLMGIGLMAILSLFPLGAAQMAQALQDQRASEAATTAAAFARVLWKQACEADEIAGNTGAIRFVDNNPNDYKEYNANGPYKGTLHELMSVSPAPQALQRFIMAMDDPDWDSPKYPMGGPPTSVKSGATPLPASGAAGWGTPSYPVLVDSIGWQANTNVGPDNPWWVGSRLTTSGPQSWRIPRRPLYIRDTSVTAAVNSPQPWIPLGNRGTGTGVAANAMQGTLPIFKQFSLTDDITFDIGGTPKTSGGSPATPGPIERQGRYTWAYMFRRSHNSARTVVDISVLLYSGRSIDVASQETTYEGHGTGMFVQSGTTVGGGPKSLTVYYTGTKPAIRRGGWVLDATVGGTPDGPHGTFYRVVNVDDSQPSQPNQPNQLSLELQTPLADATAITTPRAIVVMDKLIEVFTKKDVSPVAPPMPY